MSPKMSRLMPNSSGTARSSRRAAYAIRSGSGEPGVLEAQLQRRERYCAVDVRLHPVPLDLVAEDHERAFLLEPLHELGVHLLARGLVRREAEGVEALVGFLRLEAG